LALTFHESNILTANIMYLLLVCSYWYW